MIRRHVRAQRCLPCREAHFEVALFAQQFADMLTTRFGRGILRSLVALKSGVPCAAKAEVRHVADPGCGVSCCCIIPRG